MLESGSGGGSTRKRPISGICFRMHAWEADVSASAVHACMMIASKTDAFPQLQSTEDRKIEEMVT